MFICCGHLIRDNRLLTSLVPYRTIVSMSEHDPSNVPASTTNPLPRYGALLGLDFGTKRLGVAVCNSDQTIAVSVETWNVRTPEMNLKHLKSLIEDYRAVGFVVGLPMRLNGVEGDQAAIVRRFGTWVAEQTGLPVAYWDERHSSTEAEVLLWSQGVSPSRSKERLDRLAAQIILQGYLDSLPKERR